MPKYEANEIFLNNSKIVLKSFVFIVLLNFDIEKNILPLCDSFAQEVIQMA